MTDAVERVVAAAAALGLTLEPQRYPEGTRTAQDAAAAIGVDVARIVKSLVFVADGTEPVLVLTSGANRVDTGKVAATLGVGHVRKADADEARAATGFAIGGTPPLGHVRSLRTVLDRDVLAFDRVWVAAGTPDTNAAIGSVDLRRVSGAIVADVRDG